ncbi:putative beta-1,3-galactosyltransferase 2 isoform X1 [Gossypium australe]|uniref:Putative beta-1,3-galactosyltransferase 2 isoform X1 n=1 Tax=Gossypium australe TaxID=47621 RepID=A0A5B6VN36_9ROSI|nr:putative beta-1,3-galactosyltransferase 2 isoform X1 [Gossypium australe]
MVIGDGVLTPAISGWELFLNLKKEEKHVSKHIIGEDHVEGYIELPIKPKMYFATALALWDANFYVNVDDDVHIT